MNQEGPSGVSWGKQLVFIVTESVVKGPRVQNKTRVPHASGAAFPRPCVGFVRRGRYRGLPGEFSGEGPHLMQLSWCVWE